VGFILFLLSISDFFEQINCITTLLSNESPAPSPGPDVRPGGEQPAPTTSLFVPALKAVAAAHRVLSADPAEANFPFADKA
jgi:hypothetical protein